MGRAAKRGRNFLHLALLLPQRGELAPNVAFADRRPVVLRRILGVSEDGYGERAMRADDALSGLRELELQLDGLAAGDLRQLRREHDCATADGLRLASVAHLQPDLRSLRKTSPHGDVAGARHVSALLRRDRQPDARRGGVALRLVALHALAGGRAARL